MQVKFARTLLAGAAVAAGLFVFAPAANAQIVVQADYGSETDFGVGAGFGFPLGMSMNGTGITVEATFDYFFPSCDGCDAFGGDNKYWEINANAQAHLFSSVPGLYVGAGARYAKWSFSYDDNGFCEFFGCDSYGDGKVGLNLLGGWTFSGKRGPFVQAKYELGSGDQLVISGGLRF